MLTIAEMIQLIVQMIYQIAEVIRLIAEVISNYTYLQLVVI
nr:MAG TPA: hypothetical protein [Bacteriophage sp.]